jgi:hypothetical protein
MCCKLILHIVCAFALILLVELLSCVFYIQMHLSIILWHRLMKEGPIESCLYVYAHFLRIWLGLIGLLFYLVSFIWGLSLGTWLPLNFVALRRTICMNLLYWCILFILCIEMSSYVVYKGRVPGVYANWENCWRHVHHFRTCIYTWYNTMEEAEVRYMHYLA